MENGEWVQLAPFSILHFPFSAVMKTHTSYLTFNTKRRQEIIDITDEVENCRAAAHLDEGMVLVSAMHISASVFVNDHEPGLWQDILDWLERSEERRVGKECRHARGPYH